MVSTFPDGVEAVVLAFCDLPTFWATWQFRVACFVLILVSAWYAHNYRLQHLSRQLKLRFEERLAERTRIAQELQDTLLQGFLSASMQLHVATTAVPPDSDARALLNKVSGLMTQVIEEGRNAVRGLRCSSSKSLDLEQAFAQIPEELGSALHSDIQFRLIVDGERKSLHPLLRDEVYRIGREALLNAFHHARAKHIDIKLKYSRKQFEVIIRDDGSGIDGVVVLNGRDGHLGLLGMRERAARIGARLNVYSRPSAGTQVEISIPGHLAFSAETSQNWRKQ